MTETTTIEGRIARLEAAVQASEDARRDDERLLTGVERLADETSGLNEVLQKVDAQQRALSLMGSRVEEVEITKASKKEVEKTAEALEAQTKEAKTRITRRLYFAVTILVAFGAYFAVDDYRASQKQQQNCEARNEQNQIIVDLLAPVEQRPSAENAPVRESLNRFRELIKDCDGL